MLMIAAISVAVKHLGWPQGSCATRWLGGTRTWISTCTRCYPDRAVIVIVTLHTTFWILRALGSIIMIVGGMWLIPVLASIAIWLRTGCILNIIDLMRLGLTRGTCIWSLGLTSHLELGHRIADVVQPRGTYDQGVDPKLGRLDHTAKFTVVLVQLIEVLLGRIPNYPEIFNLSLNSLGDLAPK